MIKLKRNVFVRSFDVEGTVHISRDRPEFLAVAQLAAEKGATITGKDVVEELLGGLPEQIGWKIIERCIFLGILEREDERGPASLSEEGKLMIEKEKVLVPEEGAWRFYYISDRLIDEPFLHISKLPPIKASSERSELYKNSGDNYNFDADIPKIIKDFESENSILESSATGESLYVENISDKGADGPEGELTLTLEWSEDDENPLLALEGEIELPSKNSKEKPVFLTINKTLPKSSRLSDKEYSDLWCWLVSNNKVEQEEGIRSWLEQTGKKILPVSFNDIDEKNRFTMTMDLKIQDPSHLEIGRFEDTTIKNIKLVPQTDEDAQQWLEWLQWRSIDAYTLPEQITHVAEILKEKFPYSKTEPLDADELLEKALNNFTDQRSRFLLAPYDLGLWR